MPVGLKEAEGAMFVFSSVMDAVLKEDQSFLDPGRHNRPRIPIDEPLSLMVASVLAWNSNRLDLPRMYGSKKCFSFIKVGRLCPS